MRNMLPCDCCGRHYKRLEVRVFEWFEQHPYSWLCTREIGEMFGSKKSAVSWSLRALVRSGLLTVQRGYDWASRAWLNEYALGPKAQANYYTLSIPRVEP